MKASFWRAAGNRLQPLLMAVAGLVIAGCSQEAQTPASKPQAEVRGEPIRGEPIVPPVTAGPTTPAPTSTATAAVAEGTAAASPVVPAKPEAATAAAGNPPASASLAATSGAVAAAEKPAAPAGNSGPKDAKAGTGTPTNPLSIGFDKLASFAYALPEGPLDTNTVVQTTVTNQIPESIRSLNNQFISLKGFMLPLKVEKGLVTELLIMRDQSMCCYGTVPKINEWVSVKMVGDGVKPVMDQAVTLFGKLKVGEMYENGYLVGIYALDGEKMAGPLDL